MIDASESDLQERLGSRLWLLLIHQLPPKPDYLRVKIRRRLRRLGAVAVKHTVYVLPNTDEALEDFQWLRQEIEAAGGSAIIAQSSFVEGVSDAEVEVLLETERSPAARSVEDGAGGSERVEPGRTWVTRQGVFVDRVASAWLIRQFVDPQATFKFVRARGYLPKAGELRFDMPGAEYTHVGDDCTFQTLARRFGLRDRGIRAIGEVVHDIDCKDDMFGRDETAGIAGVLRGIAESCSTDEGRLERGFQVFDDLLAFYRKHRA